MKAKFSLISMSFWILAAGFLTCTWDIVFILEARGFTLKAHQFLFALAFALTYLARRSEGLANFLAPLASPFIVFILCLAGFYLGLSPWSSFPLKSFLYSCWLLFDILAIWLTAQHLSREYTPLHFFRMAWVVMVFLSAVIFIDQIAYYFGYVGGLIGGNQDARLRWGLSRPHAFSFEPSFIASFLSIGLITTASQMFHSSRKKLFFWSALLLNIFAVVATTSRTGWINLILGFGLLALLPMFAGRKFQLKPITTFFGLVGVVIVLFYLTTPERQRSVISGSLVGSIVKGEDGSGNARLRAFSLAFKQAKETNWVGTGLAASYRYYLDQGHSDYTEPGVFSERHFGSELIMSTWGQLLAEGGLVAIILYASAAFFLVRELFRKWKIDADGYAIGCCAASIVFFGFSAHWIGNICRGDVWVWYALWSAVSRKYSA